jgi:hypothetical protein
MPRKEKHWGIVIDNQDPEFRGRLIVQCDTIAEGDVLEWIEPSFHFVDSDNETSAGAFWVPNPGAIVEVEIEAEEDSEGLDLDPRWKCCLYSEGQVPEEFVDQDHYPNRRGWKTRAGHLFYFDDTEGDIAYYYEHPSGHKMSMVDVDGDKVFTYEHPSGTKIVVPNSGDIELSPAAGKSVFVGEGADEQIVRGNKLYDFFNDGFSGLSFFIDNHVHSAGSFTTPSGAVTGTSGTPTGSSPTFGSDILSDDHKVK